MLAQYPSDLISSSNAITRTGNITNFRLDSKTSVSTGIRCLKIYCVIWENLELKRFISFQCCWVGSGCWPDLTLALLSSLWSQLLLPLRWLRVLPVGPKETGCNSKKHWFSGQICELRVDGSALFHCIFTCPTNGLSGSFDVHLELADVFLLNFSGRLLSGTLSHGDSSPPEKQGKS